MSSAKSTVVARIYSVTLGGQTREIHVTNASELREELIVCGTDSMSAKNLVRLVWATERADVTLGDLHVWAVGQVVQEYWASSPIVRPTRKRSAEKPISSSIQNHAVDFSQELHIPIFEQLAEREAGFSEKLTSDVESLS